MTVELKWSQRYKTWCVLGPWREVQRGLVRATRPDGKLHSVDVARVSRIFYDQERRHGEARFGYSRRVIKDWDL
jgi:hypothetical protein